MAVTDLTVAARMLERDHGLASVEGGHHPAWGTANRIVPLGGTYLELIAVADETAAAASAFGRWVGAMRSPRGRLFGWAVRTSEIDAVARRLDLRVAAGSRLDPRGAELRWRSAGLEVAAAEPARPFFIEWDPRTPHPGATAVRHPAGSVELVRLELVADAARLSAWLGDGTLPLVVRPGDPAVTAVILRAAGPEIVLGIERAAG